MNEFCFNFLLTILFIKHTHTHAHSFITNDYLYAQMCDAPHVSRPLQVCSHTQASTELAPAQLHKHEQINRTCT